MQLFTSELLNNFVEFFNLFSSHGFSSSMAGFQFCKFLYVIFFLCLQLCFQVMNIILELRALLSNVSEFILGSFIYGKMLIYSIIMIIYY